MFSFSLVIPGKFGHGNWMAKVASFHILSVHYSLAVQPYSEQLTAMLNKQGKGHTLLCKGSKRIIGYRVF